jgi:hypothetical protein
MNISIAIDWISDDRFLSIKYAGILFIVFSILFSINI